MKIKSLSCRVFSPYTGPVAEASRSNCRGRFGALILASQLIAGCAEEPSAESQARDLEQYARSRGIDVEVSVEKATGAPRVIVKSNIGGVDPRAGQASDIPSDFPADVVLYPNMTVFSLAPLPQGYSVQATANEDADVIAAFIQKNMLENGWTLFSPPTQSPAMSTLRFEKDGRTTTINLIPNAGSTAVQIATLKIG